MTLKPGDVFRIPLDATTVGYGQVVAQYLGGAYYFALFARAYPSSDTTDAGVVTQDDTALLALSFDALIANGHWRPIGNAPVSPYLPLPAYKEAVGSPENIVVVDYSGNRRRPATQWEVTSLPSRTFVAPILLERALRAQHGLEPWQDEFEALRPGVFTSAELFES